MEESQICQWCFNEIIWDAEIGPESRCPHCENELGGYRTLEIGLDSEDQNAKTASTEIGKAPAWAEDNEQDNWDEAEEEEEEEDLGFRGANLSMLAAESVIQRMIDSQEEAPECPSCREYMLEAGSQNAVGESFQAKIHSAIGKPLVDLPVRTTLYICPSCFQTSSILSANDRKALIDRLASQAE
ncbi:hypothetical protein [Paenibacillus sp. HB172176]|uniref:hypothetical protein n=1 Tax=Paenibacillus sp. HB172176 TaxID=2493690 RepID=UPI00143CB01E|nr:hypothetical protein [Paenibacillus sp. HB172176]